MVKVVIGANYGDEGKGLMTDYLASKVEDKDKSLVVRFNGGAQAAHTVQTPECVRHVFGHFGSGTFAGLPTYLSKFFVVNPMLYAKEFMELKSKGVTPKVLIDGRCLVTTPYDIALNQLAEKVRGDKKHGSCGVGFNETIERSKYAKYKLTVQNILSGFTLYNILERIFEEYVPMRKAELGITADDIPSELSLVLGEYHVVSHWLIFKKFARDVNLMLNSSQVIEDTPVLSALQEYYELIFEGAQGLLLDQNHPYFPHVTRSNTGIKNVVEILKEIERENEELEIIYVTRAYMTRHGAGPFPTEISGKPHPKVEDFTNHPNEYQGALRFGLLDLDVLHASIRRDLHYVESLNHKACLAVTCLDQMDKSITFKAANAENTVSKDFFVETALENTVGLPVKYYSYGPTRRGITDRAVRDECS